MEPTRLLAAADGDARALLAASLTDWKRPIPQCPEWEGTDLVRHMGGILLWVDAIVTGGERVARRTLDAPPEKVTELASWYLVALDRALGTLGEADSQSETWTFSSLGDRRVSWWCRRLAVEVAIHRWDAQQAFSLDGGPAPQPLYGMVAAAGIEEFLLEFVPGLLAREGTDIQSGTLHFHATDGASEWWIDLNVGGSAIPQHEKADAVVRGTRSDILLWLMNRGPWNSLELIGDRGILDSWARLRL